MQRLNTELEKAIQEKRMITFDYRNANGEYTHRCVQPLCLHYKWYAWYLFNWSFDTKEYRTCKVARIQDLNITEQISMIEHDDIQQLMRESEQAYYKTCVPIEIHFSKEWISLIEEYFPDCPVEAIGAEKYRSFINVPQKERLWKALLLSFGDKVKVISPNEYKEELIRTAKAFLALHTD